MPEHRETEHCLICGSRLQPAATAEEAVCSYCGATGPGPRLRCREGHVLCGSCTSGDLLKVIEAVALNAREKNALSLAERLMDHPALPMLGCHHAYIAAGSLLAALRNSRYAKVTGSEIKAVFDRTAKQAVDESCAGTGVCGVVPALGACFSVFLDARFGSDSEQKIVMESAIRVSQAISALTGPSCCKAYVRTALETAIGIFAERFGIILPAAGTSPACRHHSRQHGCREEKCPYYRKESKDILADSIHLRATTCHS